MSPRQKDLTALWEDPWAVIERRAPSVRAAFDARGWPRPDRIDRVYPVARARRSLGFRPRYDVGRLLGLTAPRAESTDGLA
jgi:UDP-glucose 4-epimerase